MTVSCLAAGAGTGRGPWSAILCLGVIIRGETAHADLVGTAVTAALMELSVRHRIPVVHEVLLVANAAQADARCLDPRHNRGAEAARTALVMARLLGRNRALGEGRGGGRESRVEINQSQKRPDFLVMGRTNRLRRRWVPVSCCASGWNSGSKHDPNC